MPAGGSWDTVPGTTWYSTLRSEPSSGDERPRVSHTMPALEVTLLSQPGEAKRHGLVTSTVTIGREPSCTICLDDPYLSRNQAVINKRNGHFYLRALQCTSVTWLNDEKLEPGPDDERELHDEDVRTSTHPHSSPLL